MIPARGPQTLCLMQSLFCNHSAIFALQSFALWYAIVAMQSLLCNLCYAIFAMQSSLCNLCYAIFAFLCFLSSDCKKHYKTCAFCNILLKTLNNHWVSLVFASRVLENLIKPVLFATFRWKRWKTIGFPCFFELRLQSTLQNLCFLQYFAANVGKPWVFLCFFALILQKTLKLCCFFHFFIQVPIQVPLATAGGPHRRSVSYNPSKNP